MDDFKKLTTDTEAVVKQINGLVSRGDWTAAMLMEKKIYRVFLQYIAWTGTANQRKIAELILNIKVQY